MRGLTFILSLMGGLVLSGCASCKSDYEWLLQQRLGRAGHEQMSAWLFGAGMKIRKNSAGEILAGDDVVGCRAILRFENGVFSSYQLEGRKCYRPRACLLQ